MLVWDVVVMVMVMVVIGLGGFSTPQQRDSAPPRPGFSGMGPPGKGLHATLSGAQK